MSAFWNDFCKEKRLVKFFHVNIYGFWRGESGIFNMLTFPFLIAWHPYRWRIKDERLMALRQPGMAMTVFIPKCEWKCRGRDSKKMYNRNISLWKKCLPLQKLKITYYGILFSSESQEAENTGFDKDTKQRTRLMYFDLISLVSEQE